MIDWDVAVSTGVRLVRPGPQVDLADARQAVAQLRELSVTAQGHVREFTGMEPLEPAGPAVVVDRPGWIKANVDGFRVVLEPILDRLGGERMNEGGAAQLTTAVGSRVTGVQLGAVLSYLAGRVLGQYELFLPPDPDGRAPTGRLTLVAPNIVHTERELDVDPRDFRLWVCLHEETHRMQFTSSPWLRDYVQQQMQEMLLASNIDAGDLLNRLRSAGEAVADAIRGGDGNLIEVFQSEEQSEIMDRITAVMSLAEGHGDYVMDAVGPEVVPTVAEIRRRFQRRREGANRVDKVIRQLLGIDLKMKQYEEGAAFVRSVVSQVGMADFNRVWESPETLPTIKEIRNPDSWIARVVRPAALQQEFGESPAGPPPGGGSADGPSQG
ncbi:zinc-dependent metalloprotease [Streptomonospora wellingtoniae]|uniref:Zinc-dependent metalloprotease n=1 Tax=Streptomonospora wellingtoniae TaxID=3075544 RepID=A0ABU2KMX5_9ACTN|nr:zinc-dependent metalloprotease [Streptomonospora sp. DSM 45055]MDT0300581.1 zinc-dependent metalloprotease [Streptomonospora sp. DSM 45055]